MLTVITLEKNLYIAQNQSNNPKRDITGMLF
jgi:hypothetical protein